MLCTAFAFWGLGRNNGFLRRYETNGERIYFTAASQRGTAITPDLGTGTMGPGMMGGRLACATCHGADGRGGRVRMMMSSFVAPDIRYDMLTTRTIRPIRTGPSGGPSPRAWTRPAIRWNGPCPASRCLKPTWKTC